MRRTFPALLLALAVLVAIVGLVALPVAGTAPVTEGTSSPAGVLPSADQPSDQPQAIDDRERTSISDRQTTPQVDPKNVTPTSPITFEEVPTESGTATVDPDGGVVTASGLAAIDARYHERLLDERLESAPTEAAQRSAVRSHQDRLENRVLDIRADERAAEQAYLDGEIGEDQLAYELARVHLTAQPYENWVQHTELRTEETPGIDPGPQTGALVVETMAMQGPVRERAAGSVVGTHEDERLYVTVAADGLVFGTNVGDEYVREASNRELYQRNADIVIDEVDALDRVDEQYPWVAEFDSIDLSRNFQTPSITGGVYLIEVQHPHGELLTYVNTESGDVFREHQRLSHDSIPTEETVNETDSGLRMTVERTYPTGPALVTLLDEESGEPLQGDVQLNNRTVGVTGGDGTVWTVLSPGEVEITGIVGPNEISVTVGEPQTTSEQVAPTAD